MKNLDTLRNYPSRSPVEVGSIQIGGPQFVVIAGPCSIESENQFSETAHLVKAEGASLLRGGLWKMRTNPKDFQGLGLDALTFIPKILSENKMGLVTEVTHPDQIEILDDYVDMYQVGARSMYNYSLLKELGKSQKPVLLKRGFSALIHEWLKAAEYITSEGNKNIILCERGIRTFETATRNTLDLNAVVYAKAHSPFPVIVDPSHAVGIHYLIPPLAYAAAAAGADGIIVEVHPQPEKALSDGPQSLTPEQFKIMMTQLKLILKAIDRPLYEAPKIRTPS